VQLKIQVDMDAIREVYLFIDSTRGGVACGFGEVADVLTA